MDSEVQDWLIDWFSKKGQLPEPPGRDTRNYFEFGIIDSLGIMELIDDAENHFAVSFDQNDFEDRRFTTIKGLGEIITSKPKTQ